MADGSRDTGNAAPDRLSEAETDLVRAALAGEHADLEGRPVRAAVVRELLLEGRSGWVLPPAGLRIDRAIIQGCLDLEGAVIGKPFVVWHSRFEAGGNKGAIVLADARLRRVGIHSCTVEGNIVADRAEIEHGLHFGGSTIPAVLSLRGASIDGTLSLENAVLGDGSDALRGVGLRLAGPLILNNARISGVVAVPRSHLQSGIYATKVEIKARGLALNAESARLGGDLLLGEARIEGGVSLLNVRLQGRLAAEAMSIHALPTALDARGLEVSHGIGLDQAKLRGTLLLDGAKVGNGFRAEGIEVDGGETAIGADLIQIGGNWEMPRAKLIGQLAFPGARVEGQLRLTEARLFGTDIALRGDGAHLRGGCFLSRATVLGLVRLPACEIGNQLRLRGATLKVEAGTALLAAGATFRRDVELTGDCHISGAVVLDHAQILGTLDLQGSHLTSAMIARTGLPVPPAWTRAATHGDEITLSLVDARINRLVMPARAEQRPRGVVELSRAHVGSFEDYAEAWVPSLKGRALSKDGRDIDHLVLDGFVYDHLTHPSGSAGGAPRDKAAERVGARRIRWLEGQQAAATGERFKPQAWVALGERLAQQGYVEDARRIEIARRRRERGSAGMTSGARWQSRMLDWLALYGHNPWRTVVWMAAVVVLFAGIWAGAASLCTDEDCFDESVFVIRNKDAYREDRFRQTYPGFHALAYSFDVFVPFVSFGYEDHWRPNLDYGPIAEVPLPQWVDRPVVGVKQKDPTLAITIGGVLYVLGIIEAILGLVLTSLMVTGFTGLLKGRD